MITEISNVNVSDMVRLLECIALLVIVDIASAMINNTQIEERNALENYKKTRRSKTHRSTSSSSGALPESRESDADSLDASESSASKGKKDKNQPKSSNERKGWRKWHRKCSPCPEDMRLKWRDPSINWICGAYQRARRSFKSKCMMHYRNCQDGTMFVEIHSHRCANSSNIKPHGDHFFYDYHVNLSDDETNSNTETDTTSEDDSSSAAK